MREIYWVRGEQEKKSLLSYEHEKGVQLTRRNNINM